MLNGARAGPKLSYLITNTEVGSTQIYRKGTEFPNSNAALPPNLVLELEH